MAEVHARRTERTSGASQEEELLDGDMAVDVPAGAELYEQGRTNLPRMVSEAAMDDRKQARMVSG